MVSKETNRILLATENIGDEKDSLDGLNKFIKRYHTLDPSLDLLADAVKTNKVFFEVYDVMIKSLNQELETVQENVLHLENKIKFQTDVYNRLKNICLTMAIDDDSLHILENGSFEDSVDLSKMETSLSILKNVPENIYTLRIVEERSSEIFEVERNFLKRFAAFLSKVAIQSESKGELKVHRRFYEMMSKYKFIFKFGKSQEDFYRILSVLYVKKSKSLYENEFQSHLDRVSELINDNQSLAYCIDSLIKTYQALSECEVNFMKLMDITLSASEIFNSVDAMILEFLDRFFQKSKFCVFLSIHQFTNENFREPLGSLYSMLIEKYRIFEKLYFSKLNESPPSFDFAVTVNLLLSDHIYRDILEKAAPIIYHKLTDKNEYKNASKAMQNLQILYSIEDDKREEPLETAKSLSIPLIIDKGVDTADNDLNELFSFIKSDKSGADDAKAFIKSVILENTDESSKSSMMKRLSKF